MSEVRQTAFALAAVEFAEFFKEQLAGVEIGGRVPYQPSLTSPEGMSTGGGAQALQHVTLQPKGPGAAPLTVGWVNRRNWQGQIRTYGCLLAMHRQRFPNRPFDLEPASYQRFIERATELLRGQGITVQLEENPPAPLSVRPPAGGSNVALLIVAILVGLVGVGLALFVALGKK